MRRNVPASLLLQSLPFLAAYSLASPVQNIQAISSSIASSPSKVGKYCCEVLELFLGDIVSYPSSTPYVDSIDSYWSNQNVAITPSCVVSPESTQDVSQAVSILSTLTELGQSLNVGCKFAVRSGGHTPWAGAANIQDGVTIDLSALNDIDVSSDKKTTSIGPGNRWLDVYLKLDALGLAIPGGRVASVGVGGLVTGGGISFFSARAGFVCDNVVNFEVVLASGAVVNANAGTNPTLWAALKGGSNNFGIVTRIDMKTFSQGKFWGGAVVYPIQTLSQQLSAFVSYTGQKSYDIYGALINSYAWSAANGWIIANNYEYTQPIVNPPSFHVFTDIQPELFSTMRISNLSDFTVELEASNSYGRNQLFFTSTYSNDLATLTQVFNQCNASLQAVTNVKNLSWSLSLQPIVTAITKFGDSTGGNSLGLHPSDGNLALVLLTASFDNNSDIAAVTAAANDMFCKNDAYAAQANTLNSYKYLNYAYKTQNPIQGYGADNVAKLKAASKKFDPYQIFQKWVPGGFKLS